MCRIRRRLCRLSSIPLYSVMLCEDGSEVLAASASAAEQQSFNITPALLHRDGTYWALMLSCTWL